MLNLRLDDNVLKMIDEVIEKEGLPNRSYFIKKMLYNSLRQRGYKTLPYLKTRNLKK
jgi:metal-responsive CopG/Arc/MetJ family transcriptional regulator